jgi:hypothetical protein
MSHFSLLCCPLDIETGRSDDIFREVIWPIAEYKRVQGPSQASRVADMIESIDLPGEWTVYVERKTRRLLVHEIPIAEETPKNGLPQRSIEDIFSRSHVRVRNPSPQWFRNLSSSTSFET